MPDSSADDVGCTDRREELVWESFFVLVVAFHDPDAFFQQVVVLKDQSLQQQFFTPFTVFNQVNLAVLGRFVCCINDDPAAILDGGVHAATVCLDDSCGVGFQV